MREYLPLLIQFGFALAIALGGVVTSIILGKRGRRTAAKDAPYECGKDPIGGPGARFSVKFYVIAMIFILFDIEVIFMYPWAVSYLNNLAEIGWMALWSMVAFVLLVEVGHFYAYKKGVFDWNKRL
ncbi:MAG: NADH-quinone oxidoreductase subunit A [Candidatus Methylacidiphilales bacterium]